jgi:hypothetical protein
VRVVLDMFVVISQNLSETLVFGVMDGFDDVFVVAREIKETATLARRAKF